jgi:hypothetical protein
MTLDEGCTNDADEAVDNLIVNKIARSLVDWLPDNI